MKQLAKLHQTWMTILTAIPGLIWKVAHYGAKKHDASSKVTPTEQSAETSRRSSAMRAPPASAQSSKDQETRQPDLQSGAMQKETDEKEKSDSAITDP